MPSSSILSLKASQSANANSLLLGFLKIAAGWYVPIKECRFIYKLTVLLCHLKVLSISFCAEILPTHTTILGLIILNCFLSQFMHISCSSGFGSRFLGGRHLTIFAIYTFLSRDRSTLARNLSSS